MDRDRISRLAHADHPLASPLDDDSVRRLLAAAVPRGDERLLDLGCGGAEWLLRALIAYPQARAEGVDTSRAALDRAWSEAGRLGVQDRLVLHQQDAATFTSPHRFDLVLGCGVAHLFGGLLGTIAAAHPYLSPSGRVLVGDGFWAGSPSPEAVAMLGEATDLATAVELVVAYGWTPVSGHVSTRRELDDYEWAWTGSLASWALDHRDDPDHQAALEAATTHRTEWLRDYRDTWGFVCLVLRRTEP